MRDDPRHARAVHQHLNLAHTGHGTHEYACKLKVDCPAVAQTWSGLAPKSSGSSGTTAMAATATIATGAKASRPLSAFSTFIEGSTAQTLLLPSWSTVAPSLVGGGGGVSWARRLRSGARAAAADEGAMRCTPTTNASQGASAAASNRKAKQ